MSTARIPTAVDAIAEGYLDRLVAIDPLAATYFGIAGYDDQMPDLSPDGLSARANLRTDTLAALGAAQPTDANDRITATALRDELELAEELRAISADEAALNNLESPSQAIRDVFDLMPTAGTEDWSVVARRLALVPQALTGYIAALRSAAARGVVAPRRQVAAVITQCGGNVGADGFFATFTGGATLSDNTPLPESLRADLQRGAAAASDSYAGLAAFLQEELLPLAPERDAVGIEAYALHSRSFLGTRINLAETYEWGQQELARIATDQANTAEQILPGGSVREAMAFLDADPSRLLEGTDALQAWMQDKSDTAVAALADAHFDIPEAIRTLECRIAPTHTGGIYYTGPSDDLVTRPGRMWWSVPEGVTQFATWKQLTTVYHEGVPGHHLQVAQTVYRRELLNRWRRLACWISGHGEGWALYAERLMADLGFLDDPADYLGMLDSQSFRAARVVVDIGVHCGFPAPAEVGGGSWDYDKAWRFLNAHAVMAEPVMRFELDRYLGWPGQAPSYKIGERFWLQLRDDVRAEQGDAFDLKAFHRKALDVGSVGLDVLRSAVLGEFD